MAITDIHINKKIIVKHIIDTTNVSIEVADQYVYNKSSLLGFYNTRSHHICLMLDRIKDAHGLFDNNDTPEGRVCYCLIHEEIHHWLYENEGSKACWAFDNIAHKFMGGM